MTNDYFPNTISVKQQIWANIDYNYVLKQQLIILTIRLADPRINMPCSLEIRFAENSMQLIQRGHMELIF